MIQVLRLGHRPQRDKRVTTHLGLVARAFGADSIVLTVRDKRVEESLKRINEKFGGRFSVEYTENWREYIRDWEGIKVHLTMYGESINEIIDEIPKSKAILIIVGAEKVPREVYELADFNVAVGNQPHSEVSALAVFLDRYFQGKELERDFNGKVKIVPMRRGKKVMHDYPSREECIELLKRAGCSDDVIEHCKVVAELALLIGKRANANLTLIECSALLHDIGRARTHGIRHGIEGARIAREFGIPDEIVRIIERHVGAGIPKDEAESLGLPAKDFLPVTLEEKIVAHADNLIDLFRGQGIKDAVKGLERKGEKKAVERMLMLHDELSSICKIDLDSIAKDFFRSD